MLNHYSSRASSRIALSLALVACMAGQARAQAAPPQPAQHGANPTVSPGGWQIAFVSDRAGTGDVYVINTDGSGIRRLTSDGGHSGRAYWSADGRRLQFSVSANDTARVFALPAEGGAAAEIGRFPARTGAILFPDRSRFLYGVGSWTETQLVTSRADGSDRLPLTSDHAAYWCAALSPDGDRVAATRQDSTGMQIWIVSTDGSGARALTHFTKAQGRPQCAAFSPDGRRIAVQSEMADPQDTTREIGHLWIIDVASGRATRLAEHTAPYRDELPAWFPDGRRLAFQSDRTGQWEVWVMNADGTGARQVTR
jgi:TolB protein